MPHTLTAAQVEHYHSQGYVVASGIFSAPELDELERELDGAMQRRLRNSAKIDATWQGDWKDALTAGTSTEAQQAGAAAGPPPRTEILHTHDLQAYSAAFARALVHDRFTGALADLLGPNVALHHTKGFIKPPEKGSAFPMHQDYPYFPHALGTMLAAIVHLSDATEEMGCVCVYPGTHQLGPLPIVNEKQPYLDPAQWPINKATPLPAQRGDVLFFNYLLVHGSDINRSQRVRKTALFQVRDAADRPCFTHRDNSHALGLILRGINPLANGEAIAIGSGT